MALTDRERSALADAVRDAAERVRRANKAEVIWLRELVLRGDDARHLNHHMVACEVAFGLDLTDEKLMVSRG